MYTYSYNTLTYNINIFFLQKKKTNNITISMCDLSHGFATSGDLLGEC